MMEFNKNQIVNSNGLYMTVIEGILKERKLGIDSDELRLLYTEKYPDAPAHALGNLRSTFKRTNAGNRDLTFHNFLSWVELLDIDIQVVALSDEWEQQSTLKDIEEFKIQRDQTLEGVVESDEDEEQTSDLKKKVQTFLDYSLSLLGYGITRKLSDHTDMVTDFMNTVLVLGAKQFLGLSEGDIRFVAVNATFEDDVYVFVVTAMMGNEFVTSTLISKTID